MVYTVGWVGGDYKYVQKYIVGWADLLPLSTPSGQGAAGGILSRVGWWQIYTNKLKGGLIFSYYNQSLDKRNLICF